MMQNNRETGPPIYGVVMAVYDAIKQLRKDHKRQKAMKKRREERKRHRMDGAS